MSQALVALRSDSSDPFGPVESRFLSLATGSYTQIDTAQQDALKLPYPFEATLTGAREHDLRLSAAKAFHEAIVSAAFLGIDTGISDYGGNKRQFGTALIPAIELAQSMIQRPLSGEGLGNFVYVFQMYEEGYISGIPVDPNYACGLMDDKWFQDFPFGAKIFAKRLAEAYHPKNAFAAVMLSLSETLQPIVHGQLSLEGLLARNHQQLNLITECRSDSIDILSAQEQRLQRLANELRQYKLTIAYIIQGLGRDDGIIRIVPGSGYELDLDDTVRQVFNPKKPKTPTLNRLIGIYIQNEQYRGLTSFGIRTPFFGRSVGPARIETDYAGHGHCITRDLLDMYLPPEYHKAFDFIEQKTPVIVQLTADIIQQDSQREALIGASKQHIKRLHNRTAPINELETKLTRKLATMNTLLSETAAFYRGASRQLFSHVYR